MRNYLNFESAQRRTKETAGITNVTMISVDKAGETSQDIGTIVRPAGVSAFSPITNAGDNLGDFDTRNLAAGILKRDFQGNSDAAPEADDTGDTETAIVTASLEDAAAVLCPKAKNQVSALKKKISRGKIATVEVDGETRVIMPAVN